MAELVEGDQSASVERITIRGLDGAAIDAIHARPEKETDRGLVVHSDIMGLRPLFDDLARRLATHGYAVCAPEAFQRAPENVREPFDSATRQAYVGGWNEALQLGDLVAAADWLAAVDGVSDVSVLGFCVGGTMAFKAAATGRFERAVAMYGPVVMRAPWAALPQPLDIADLMCPTLAIFAGDDPYVPSADVDALREAWGGRTDCDVVVYPEAQHAFVHAVDHDVHRPDDAADAWDRTLEFLRAPVAARR